MTIELGQWRLFVTLADCGSLMKAAEVLHTDQPALSRSLRRLERLVGAPLFVRTSRGLTLTELGERLLTPARSLLNQADALESQALAEARKAHRVLKVGALDFYPLTTATAEACQSLTADQAVRTELVGVPWLAHPKAVRDRLIDVGFTLTVDGALPDAPRMRCQPLWDEPEAFALVSRHHPGALEEQMDPRALADLPLHLPAKEDNPDIHDLVLELLADAGVPAPRRAPPLRSLAAVIQQVAAGYGWTLITGTLARHALPGTVAVPLRVSSRHTVQLALIWHSSADQTIISAFSENLQSALARESPTPAT